MAQHVLGGPGVVDVSGEASALLIGRPGSVSGDDLWMAGLDSLVDAERAGELDVLACVQGIPSRWTRTS